MKNMEVNKLKTENRIKILNVIFEDFQQITQWLPNNIEFAIEYMYKAKGLIELLEVEDCGSVGGFDPKSPVIRESSPRLAFDLYDRYLAVVRRCDNEKDINKECYFDLNSLKMYFKELHELREKFNK